MRAPAVRGSGVDERIMRFAAGHRSFLFTRVSQVVMALGGRKADVVAVVIVAVYVWRTRRWVPVAAAGVAALGSLGSAAVLKQLIARPRPPVARAIVYASGYSMPSSDAAFTAAVAAAAYLAWRAGADPRIRRWVAGALVAVNLLVGLCLVYVGAHWATDVLAGWALGVAVAVAAVRLVREVAGRRSVPARS